MQVKRTMYFRRLAENCQRLGGGTRLANSENTRCGGAFGFFLLLLALGVRLRFARIEVGVVVAVVVVVILVGLLLLAVALVLQRLPGEEEDGSGDDSLADVVPDLKVGSEECLSGGKMKLGRLADFSGVESLWMVFRSSVPTRIIPEPSLAV